MNNSLWSPLLHFFSFQSEPRLGHDRRRHVHYSRPQNDRSSVYRDARFSSKILWALIQTKLISQARRLWSSDYALKRQFWLKINCRALSSSGSYSMKLNLTALSVSRCSHPQSRRYFARWLLLLLHPSLLKSRLSLSCFEISS